ncbi:MAG: citramalate synthase [Phycisphaeraceae bacterium]
MQTSQPHGRRIELYDTTLRDGAQGAGVAFSLVEKIKITQHLDALGVDYIEGGYPLSNPKDAAYFAEVAKLQLKHARVCAFGMTRRKGMSAAADPGMKALVAAATPVITIVGKTWGLHVDEVLRVSREENLAMIRESVAFCCQADSTEVFYDAEHFFDGYRANCEYALATLTAALEGGAGRLILCDTNGGSLPGWISQVVQQVQQYLGSLASSPKPQASSLLGIHCHNDSGLAVANSLAAVEAGAVQVQGTINGIGERCGNVDLTTVAATLCLKMGYQCLSDASLSKLTETSRFVYEAANMNLIPNQPFVGSAAFAHKGGMHVHAVQRVAHSYEHVEPEKVGNVRRVLVSELSGASNISATLGRKFNIADNKQVQRQLLERVQELEHQGYQFETATASFELLLHDVLGTRPRFWELDHYRCVILKRDDEPASTEAIVKLAVNGAVEHRVAEGDGPVNALDAALRKCLKDHYPQITEVHLTDYKVRVVNPTAESAAKVRVIAEFAVRPDNENARAASYFSTVGVNENIVDASWQAITDAFAYHLIEVARGDDE